MKNIKYLKIFFVFVEAGWRLILSFGTFFVKLLKFIE